MTIEVSGNNSVAVHSVTQVATDKVRIRDISFDFADEVMRLTVAYAVGSVDKSTEQWFVSGPPLAQILGFAPVGNTRKAVFREFVGDIASRIQNTPNLKADLIAAGNLIVR